MNKFINTYKIHYEMDKESHNFSKMICTETNIKINKDNIRKISNSSMAYVELNHDTTSGYLIALTILFLGFIWWPLLLLKRKYVINLKDLED